jgi:hypothetical protein
VLVRGAYDKPGEKVTPETPGFLPPLAKDAPRNRLGLANWLVSDEHPLMARVTVNRYWQMFFGTDSSRQPKILAHRVSCRVIRSCWIGWRWTFERGQGTGDREQGTDGM